MTKGDKYRRVPRIVCAELLDQSWEWRTASGALMTARPGDFRVWDASKPADAWSVTADAFAWGYRLIGAGRFESRGDVLARQVVRGQGCELVASFEGDALAQPGDWIVTDPAGRQWIVRHSEFVSRYVPIRHDA